jgi:excisionase family DNA binding protein
MPQHDQHDLLAAIESHTTAMTIEQVAALFQKSDETIRRMAVKKQLPAFKFGGEWRFNPASLGYWLRSRDPLAAKASKAVGRMRAEVA